MIAGALAVLGALVFLALGLGGWWSLPAALSVLAAAWVVWFFRDPARDGPRDARLILAPADGRVVGVVEENEPEFMGSAARRVSVFMNIFDVHVNRYPASGVIRHREYRPGAFLNATLDKASEANERLSLGLETPRGPLLVRQIAGLVARRIATDGTVGSEVSQGDRLGMIRFGSRVDTFFPPDVLVRVRIGDRTKAGVTVLAEWPQ